jgi:hypothetical protein
VRKRSRRGAQVEVKEQEPPSQLSAGQASAVAASDNIAAQTDRAAAAEFPQLGEAPPASAEPDPTVTLAGTDSAVDVALVSTETATAPAVPADPAAAELEDAPTGTQAGVDTRSAIAAPETAAPAAVYAAEAKLELLGKDASKRGVELDTAGLANPDPSADAAAATGDAAVVDTEQARAQQAVGAAENVAVTLEGAIKDKEAQLAELNAQLAQVSISQPLSQAASVQRPLV